MSELGSWAGLYHWATEKLMLERLAAEKDVLQVLANRANPIGFCWPGVGYIANMVGRMDSTVENALRRLELMDFICTVKTQNLIRNRVDVDYQVSPYVLFIAPDKLPLAMELWEQNRQNRNVEITNEIKESQPPPESRILKPTTVTNDSNQPHHHHQNPAALFEGVPRDGNANPGENAKTGGKEDSGKAAKTPAAKPQLQNPSLVPTSPSPPAEKLTCYDAPLPDEAAEQIAAEMNAKTRFMMSVAVARGLVAKYGAAKCEAALTHMALQTNVRSPAGYLRTKIENGEIDPVQDAKIPVEEADAETFTSGSEYVTGKYAAYIKYQSDDENEQESSNE